VAAGSQRRILIAEDDHEMRTLLAEALNRDGYKVGECSDGVDLLIKLGGVLTPMGTFALVPAPAASEPCDLIISDIRMPFLGGLEILMKLEAIKHPPPVILITAFGDPNTHAHARRLGAAAVFDKPFDTEDLLAKVREIVRHR